MKILIVTETFKTGGLETQVMGFCRCLRNSGHEVHLISGLGSRTFPLREIIGDNILEVDMRPDISNKEAIGSINKIVSYVKEIEADMLHLHPFTSLIYGGIAASITIKPYVVTIHGPLSLTYGYNPTYRLFIELIQRDAWRVFCISEETAERVRAIIPEGNVKILPNGVDTEKFKPAQRDPSGPVALIARLDVDKIAGVKSFLSEWSKLPGDLRRPIHIFGEGNSFEDLKKWVKDLFGGGSWITFKGQEDRLGERLETGYSAIAGMGRVVIEAGAMNLPVILVGYDGPEGLVSLENCAQLSYRNFSGRYAPIIGMEKIKEELWALNISPERFLLRPWVLRNADEKDIVEKYRQQIENIRPSDYKWREAFLSSIGEAEDTSLFGDKVFQCLLNSLPQSQSNYHWVNLYLSDKINRTIAEKDALGGQLSQTIAGKEALGRQLAQVVSEKEELGGQLAQVVSEKEELGGQLAQVVSEKEALGGQLARVVSEKETLNGRLAQEILEKNNLWNQLNSIYSSNFWKVASRYYKARNSSIVLRGIYLLLRWLKRKIKDRHQSSIRKTSNNSPAHTCLIPDQLSGHLSEPLSRLVLVVESAQKTFSWRTMRTLRRFRGWVVLGNLKSRWEFCKWMGRKISRQRESFSSPDFDPIGSDKFYDLESLQKAIRAARKIRAWKIMCLLRALKVELVGGDLKNLLALGGLIEEIVTNKEGKRWVAYDPIPEELMKPPTQVRFSSASAPEAFGDMRETFIFALDRGWGDILMSVPVAETLKKRDGEARIIYFLEREDHVPLLQNNPFIDGIYLSRDHIPSYINAKIFDIRRTPSDWHRARIHITDMIANHFGISVHTHRPSLYIPDNQVVFKKFGLRDPYVVVHMQSTTKEKDWKLDYWVSVFKHLFREYRLNTVIVGGFDEAVLPSGDLPYIFDLRGNISLVETVNLIKRARLFVGIDSGPMHIAGALNIPSIVLWGNTSPIICGINPDVVYNIEPERICQKGADWACHFFPCPENELCINRISVERVIGCIDDCLSEKTGLLVIHIGKNPWLHAGWNAKGYTFLQQDSFKPQALNEAIYANASEYVAIVFSESSNPPWDELERIMGFIKTKGIRIVSTKCLRYVGHGVYGEYTENRVTKSHRGSDDFILFHRNVFARIGRFDSRFIGLSGCLRDFYFRALLLNETIWYMKSLLPPSKPVQVGLDEEEIFQRKWYEVDLWTLEHLESISLTSHYEKDVTLFLIFSHCSFDFNGGGQRWDSLTKFARRSGYRLFYIDDVIKDERAEVIVREFLETPAPRKIVIWARPVPRYQRYFDHFLSLAIPQVYDCIDDWREIMKEDQAVSSFEEELLKKTSLVTVTGETLREKIRMIRPWQDNVPFIPNGADPEIFDYKRNYERPTDLKKGPLTIGYFGSLAEWWIDDDLMSRLATRLGDQTAINLIGPCNEKYRGIFSKYTNIALLGQKNHEQLPAYLSHFDVALIPFRLIPVTQATNPVKVYEYLFGGKPVVSTDLPEVRRLPFTLCSKDPEEFLGNVLKASRMKMDHRELDKFRSLNAWKSRFQELLTQIQIINIAGNSVDIVIVSYNTKELTYNCIRSIERHTKNHHIFVVDNQSADGSIEMLEEFSRKGQLSLIKNQKNEGYGRAVNKAIPLGSSKFIAILNSDVEVLSGWLDPLFEALDSDDQVAAVGPKLIGPSGNIDSAGVWGTNAKPLIRFAEKNHLRSFNRVLENVYISGACMVTRRKTFEELGKFDERFFFYFEDMDLCFKARYQGYKILYIPHSVVVHHRSKASEANKDQIQRWYTESQFRFVEKWKDRMGDIVEYPLN